MSKSLGNSLLVPRSVEVSGRRGALVHGVVALPQQRRVLRRSGQRGRDGVPAHRGLRATARSSGSARCRRARGCRTPSRRTWTRTSGARRRWPCCTRRCARETQRWPSRRRRRRGACGAGRRAGDDRRAGRGPAGPEMGSTALTTDSGRRSTRWLRWRSTSGSRPESDVTMRRRTRYATRSRPRASWWRTPRRDPDGLLRAVPDGRQLPAPRRTTYRRFEEGPTGGSGGQRGKALRGKGPTPPAEVRTGHPAARRAKSAAKKSATSSGTRSGSGSRSGKPAPGRAGGRRWPQQRAGGAAGRRTRPGSLCR